VAGESEKLKVFISWAGERANAIGSGFHEFLPDVVNAVHPFMSGKNIDKGTRWSEVLSNSLQESACAIVCLTPDSIQSVWVAFEAGAISRAAGGIDGARSRIWTYLSALQAPDLQLTPFAEYQATNATQDETFRLVRSINQLSPDPVSGDSLKRRFDAVFWPNFSKVLDQVRAMGEATTSLSSDPRSSSEPEVLQEILRTLRAVQREVTRPYSAAFSGMAPVRTEQSVREVINRLTEMAEETLFALGQNRKVRVTRSPDGKYILDFGGPSSVAISGAFIDELTQGRQSLRPLFEEILNTPDPPTEFVGDPPNFSRERQ